MMTNTAVAEAQRCSGILCKLMLEALLSHTTKKVSHVTWPLFCSPAPISHNPTLFSSAERTTKLAPEKEHQGCGILVFRVQERYLTVISLMLQIKEKVRNERSVIGVN